MAEKESEIARITKIIRIENKGAYARIHVKLDHGGEGVCYVGGQVEEFFDKGQTKVFIKRAQSLNAEH